MYIEPWHRDIESFIDLKKNSGEERRRTHDLFPALWINDLFMQRIKDDSYWTLFDPYEVSDLNTLYGEEFNKKYIEYENDDSKNKEKIRAKDLWKKILTSYYESGSPFLCFKDNANKANPNNHTGFIRSSNLCTEIFQNTEPNHYKVKIEYENGSFDFFEEHEEVKIDSQDGFIVKKANKITSLDSINGKKVFLCSKTKTDGKTAVCNLASINLSKLNTKEEMERLIPIAVRMLDNVIDLNFYPLRKVKVTNLQTRSIGLGIMGEAQMLAEQGIHFGSDEHFHKMNEIMEIISYNTIKASCELAKEKGSYPEFKGSMWSKGIMPHDYQNIKVDKIIDKTLFDDQYDWRELREDVKKGIRNGYLMAIAPTSSISILVGTTQTIEPIYKKKWFEENLSGLIPVVAPKISPSNWKYYTSAYEIDQLQLIKAAAIRQKWIDQGQSLNIFIDIQKASGKYLNDIYMLAWDLGLKSTYYLRSQSPEVNNDVADRSMECLGCQ